MRRETSIAWYGTLWPAKATVCVQLPVSRASSCVERRVLKLHRHRLELQLLHHLRPHVVLLARRVDAAAAVAQRVPSLPPCRAGRTDVLQRSYENQRSLHSTAVAESCIGTSADIAGCVFERGLSGFLLRASTSMHEKSPKSRMGHSSTHLAWMDFFSVYSPNTPPGTTLFHRPSPAAAPQHRGADPLPIRRVFFFTSAALACGRPAASWR